MVYPFPLLWQKILIKKYSYREIISIKRNNIFVDVHFVIDPFSAAENHAAKDQ